MLVVVVAVGALLGDTAAGCAAVTSRDVSGESSGALVRLGSASRLTAAGFGFGVVAGSAISLALLGVGVAGGAGTGTGVVVVGVPLVRGALARRLLGVVGACVAAAASLLLLSPFAFSDDDNLSDGAFLFLTAATGFLVGGGIAGADARDDFSSAATAAALNRADLRVDIFTIRWIPR